MYLDNCYKFAAICFEVGNSVDVDLDFGGGT